MLEVEVEEEMQRKLILRGSLLVVDVDNPGSDGSKWSVVGFNIPLESESQYSAVS